MKSSHERKGPSPGCFERSAFKAGNAFPSANGLFQEQVSRRSFLKSAGMLAGSVLLASCAPGVSQAKTSGGPAQLVYQDWQTDWFPAMAQETLEKFHTEHQNIQVFYTPDPENLDSQMMSDFISGTAPDVMAGCCDFFPDWAQKGYLLDLRPFIEADLDNETLNDWDSVQYRALALKDGTQYALPKYHGALALFYNKDIFDRFNLDYPDKSWNHAD